MHHRPLYGYIFHQKTHLSIRIVFNYHLSKVPSLSDIDKFTKMYQFLSTFQSQHLCRIFCMEVSCATVFFCQQINHLFAPPMQDVPLMFSINQLKLLFHVTLFASHVMPYKGPIFPSSVFPELDFSQSFTILHGTFTLSSLIGLASLYSFDSP